MLRPRIAAYAKKTPTTNITPPRVTKGPNWFDDRSASHVTRPAPAIPRKATRPESKRSHGRTVCGPPWRTKGARADKTMIATDDKAPCCDDQNPGGVMKDTTKAITTPAAKASVITARRVRLAIRRCLTFAFSGARFFARPLQGAVRPHVLGVVDLPGQSNNHGPRKFVNSRRKTGHALSDVPLALALANAIFPLLR